MINEYSMQKVLIISKKDGNRFLERALAEYCPSAAINKVSDSGKGIELLRRERADAVFIDSALAVDNTNFFREIQKNNIDSPVVVIVEKGKEIIAAEAIKEGAYDYIVQGTKDTGTLPRVVERIRNSINLRKEREQLPGERERQAVLFSQIWKSQKWWQNIIDAIKDYIFVLDNKYRILRTNKAFAGLFGKDPADIIMMPYYELYGLEEPHEWCNIHKDNDRVSTGAVERNVNGIVYLISSFPIFHDQHDAMVYIMKDITETRRLKDQIYHMDKLSSLGTLTSGVAHEINNPLTGIIGYTEMLLMNHSGENTEKYLRNIYDSAIRCKRIVENMLTFSRQKQPHKYPDNINDIIDKTLELHEYWLKSTNIEILRNYGKVPYTAVDRQQMQQVVLNLLINAEHAISETGRRGRIEFKTDYDKDANNIIITVSDNGAGIPPEILPKIFDPFFTTKPVNVGTGLGLSIAHGIIAEQGGTIEVKSETGVGTLFTITLAKKDW
ncbi:MAG: PAS domain-containing protein [Nitrospiraceae bacterium]|nr:MAG: PAS domain-containing protein [Nitrospiraceae bacterium]